MIKLEITRLLKILKSFSPLTYTSIGVGIILIISVALMIALEAQFKESGKKNINIEKTPAQNIQNFNGNKISSTPAIVQAETPASTTAPSKLTATPTLTRTPNPPIGGISWPAEGETINATEDKLCFVDAGTGGDLSGVQRRKNINNGGWENFIPVYPTSDTCFYPKEGSNTFSIQFRNQYQEESSVYNRSFIFRKQIPTPTPKKDTTPPSITITSPAEGAIITQDAVCFNMNVTDNTSKTPNLWIIYKFEGGNWNAWTNSYSVCITSRGDNPTVIFSVKAKDEAGNESSPITRTITVKVN